MTAKTVRWRIAAAVLLAVTVIMGAAVAGHDAPLVGGTDQQVDQPYTGVINGANLPPVPLGPVDPNFTGGPPQQPNMGTKPPVIATLAPATPLPSGGISRDRAIEIARTHIGLATVSYVEVGRVGDLSLIVNPAGIGIKLDRLVWKVSFIGDTTVCYHAVALVPIECSTPFPIMLSVFLDYYTGDFLFTD